MKRMATLIAALVMAGSLCAASEPRFIIEAPGVSYLSGYTRYEIHGAVGDTSWRSRLTFPMDNVCLGAGVGFDAGSVASVRLRGWFTVDRKAGTMRDDDWLNGVRDIWSRSDAALSAWGLELQGDFWALDTAEVSLGPRLRLAYDTFDYDIKNVRQDAIDPLDRAEVDGLVMTYRQDRFAVVPCVAFRWRPVAWAAVELSAGVSPLHYLWDEDDHILRYKLSRSEALAWSFCGQARVDFTLAPHLRAGLWAEYLTLRSWWGRQDQRFYDGPYKGLRFNHVSYRTQRANIALGLHLTVAF